MTRLAVLVCEYGPARRRRAFRRVRAALRSLRAFEPFFVRIDNSREGEWAKRHSPRSWSIGGDNAGHEFSAWAKGLRWLRDGDVDASLCLFATDALEAYGDRYDALLDDAVLEFVLARDAAAGLVDRVRPGYRELDLRFLDWRLVYWVRTSFFVLTARTIGRLGTLATVEDVSGFCPEAFDGRAFSEAAPVTAGYAAYVEDWLTGDWHGAFELTPGSWERFRAKARSIVNEQALTCRLRALGHPVHDLRFLRARSIANGGRLLGADDPVLRALDGDPLAEVDHVRRAEARRRERRGGLARLLRR